MSVGHGCNSQHTLAYLCILIERICRTCHTQIKRHMLYATFFSHDFFLFCVRPQINFVRLVWPDLMLRGGSRRPGRSFGLTLGKKRNQNQLG